MDPLLLIIFFAYAKPVNSNGYPNYSAANANPSWSNIQVSTSNITYTLERNVLNFLGINHSMVIPNGNNHIEFDMSTANNGVYPGVFFYQTHIYPDGAGQEGYPGTISVNSNGTCFGREPGPGVLPPIDEIDPPEPDFKLSSAVWELESVDIGDLPHINSVSTGYQSTIKQINNNQFCIDYVTAGIKNNPIQIGGKSVFKMNGASGSQLLYLLSLVSHDGNSAYNFAFPSVSTKYIPLSQTASSMNKRSQMCWTPSIQLYKDDTTQGGLHNDSLNFVIIPKA
ncbi:hypothetical protein K7H99_20805 (plasmid) [Providencia rettgeri]|uniref:hypothetical protein n=1 Tax=Providencia rettgeri TaxID=587 RepID=UPI001CA62D8D|nr:hypothetical protein K7H99_20805 [Providencia rettgeri]